MTGCRLLAKDVMVTRLVTVLPTMDVFEAIHLLLDHKISGAPVVDDQQNFLGVFSEKCSMNVLVEASYDQLPSSEVFAFMDVDVRTITEETDLLTIAQIFLNTRHRRLPVLKDGKLVGQISRRDVLRAAQEMNAAASNREKALLYLGSRADAGRVPIA